jgi:hypothetical protein
MKFGRGEHIFNIMQCKKLLRKGTNNRLCAMKRPDFIVLGIYSEIA